MSAASLPGTGGEVFPGDSLIYYGSADARTTPWSWFPQRVIRVLRDAAGRATVWSLIDLNPAPSDTAESVSISGMSTMALLFISPALPCEIWVPIGFKEALIDQLQTVIFGGGDKRHNGTRCGSRRFSRDAITYENLSLLLV